MKEVYNLSTDAGIVIATLKKNKSTFGNNFTGEIIGEKDLIMTAESEFNCLLKLKVAYEVRMSVWLKTQLINSGIKLAHE